VKREERDFRGRSETILSRPEGRFKFDLEFLVLEVEESLSRLAVNLVCAGGVVVGLGGSEMDIVYGMVQYGRQGC
jgi:hypothetical protein